MLFNPLLNYAIQLCYSITLLNYGIDAFNNKNLLNINKNLLLFNFIRSTMIHIFVRKAGSFMKVTGKASLSFGVRILTDVLVAGNIGTLLFLPLVLRFLYDLWLTKPYFPEDYTFMIWFLYICGMLTLAVLVFGHLILRTIEKGQPFDFKNPVYFRYVGISFLLLSAAFFIKLFFYGTILTVFCAGVFLIFALLAVIMSEVFRQASLIWEEHQLTI